MPCLGGAGGRAGRELAGAELRWRGSRSWMERGAHLQLVLSNFCFDVFVCFCACLYHREFVLVLVLVFVCLSQEPANQEPRARPRAASRSEQFSEPPPRVPLV